MRTMVPWKYSSKGVMVPKLHSVSVSRDGLSLDQQNELYREMHNWCKEYLKDKFYGAPAWTTTWQFEDDEDATAFALRWAR